MIEDILPYLGDFIDAQFAPDGDSRRSIDVPLNYPTALDSDDLPVFINQIVRMPFVQQTNSLYAVYNVVVRSHLYYIQVGQDIALKNQYDLYHYASQYVQALINYPTLYVAGATNVPNIASAVTMGDTRIPTILPYPPDDPNAIKYVGATFDLIIPIRVTKCN